MLLCQVRIPPVHPHGLLERSDQGMPYEDSDVRWLIEAIEEHGLAEIEVAKGDLRICVRAHASTVAAAAPVAAPVPKAAAPAAAPPAAAPVPSGVPVLSPMAGIFYRQPSPDADPFVEEGDRVEAGDVVGLIEVMKLFNEITAPVTGVVSRIVVETQERIEADDPLLYIQPASREEQ